MLFSVLRATGPIGRVLDREIYFEELANVIIEAGESKSAR